MSKVIIMSNLYQVLSWNETELSRKGLKLAELEIEYQGKISYQSGAKERTTK